MCLIEVWRYSECKCQFAQTTPCPYLSSPDSRWNLPKTITPPLLSPSRNFSTVQYARPEETDSGNGLTSTDADGQAIDWECCPFVRVQSQAFLESICDDCLLKELGFRDDDKVANCSNYVSLSENKGIVPLEDDLRKDMTNDMDGFHGSSTDMQDDTDVEGVHHQPQTDLVSTSESKLEEYRVSDTATDIFGRTRPRNESGRRRGIDLRPDQLNVFPSTTTPSESSPHTQTYRPLTQLSQKTRRCLSKVKDWCPKLRGNVKAITGDLHRSLSRMSQRAYRRAKSPSRALRTSKPMLKEDNVGAASPLKLVIVKNEVNPRQSIVVRQDSKLPLEKAASNTGHGLVKDVETNIPHKSTVTTISDSDEVIEEDELFPPAISWIEHLQHDLGAKRSRPSPHNPGTLQTQSLSDLLPKPVAITKSITLNSISAEGNLRNTSIQTTSSSIYSSDSTPRVKQRLHSILKADSQNLSHSYDDLIRGFYPVENVDISEIDASILHSSHNNINHSNRSLGITRKNNHAGYNNVHTVHDSEGAYHLISDEDIPIPSVLRKSFPEGENWQRFPSTSTSTSASASTCFSSCESATKPPLSYTSSSTPSESFPPSSSSSNDDADPGQQAIQKSSTERYQRPGPGSSDKTSCADLNQSSTVKLSTILNNLPINKINHQEEKDKEEPIPQKNMNNVTRRIKRMKKFDSENVVVW